MIKIEENKRNNMKKEREAWENAARKEGMKEGMKNVAKKMKEKGIEIGLISDITGLKVEEI